MTTLIDKCHYHPHFTGRETEAPTPNHDPILLLFSKMTAIIPTWLYTQRLVVMNEDLI